jgi:hypothetical protein
VLDVDLGRGDQCGYGGKAAERAFETAMLYIADEMIDEMHRLGARR